MPDSPWQIDPSWPLETQVGFLMDKAAPLPMSDLSECVEARERLMENFKNDPAWREAILNVCLNRVTRVMLARGRDHGCLRGRQAEANFLMDLAMECHPPLRNGLRFPTDPPNTPQSPSRAG